METKEEINLMESEALVELLLRFDRSLSGSAPHILGSSKDEISMFSVIRKKIIERMDSRNGKMYYEPVETVKN